MRKQLGIGQLLHFLAEQLGVNRGGHWYWSLRKTKPLEQVPLHLVSRSHRIGLCPQEPGQLVVAFEASQIALFDGVSHPHAQHLSFFVLDFGRHSQGTQRRVDQTQPLGQRTVCTIDVNRHNRHALFARPTDKRCIPTSICHPLFGPPIRTDLQGRKYTEASSLSQMHRRFPPPRNPGSTAFAGGIRHHNKGFFQLWNPSHGVFHTQPKIWPDF